MGVGTIGLMYGGATLVALFSGIPIAFALGGVATVFMMVFMPAASLDTIAQNVYEELASITLLTIPCSSSRGRRSASRAPARICTTRCIPGCTACRAGSGWPW